ncbi:hypothetical protein OIU92_22080 [Escherichia coli]|nr:hypothetical protein [Escherichia coli]
MKQSAGNINGKTSRFFKQTNNISKYDSSRRGKSFSPEQFLKNGNEQKWGDIPGRFHRRRRSRNKNSVPEQRTGNLPVMQYRQNNLYATYTPDVHLSAVMAEHGCAGEYNPGENAF